MGDGERSGDAGGLAGRKASADLPGVVGQFFLETEASAGDQQVGNVSGREGGIGDLPQLAFRARDLGPVELEVGIAAGDADDIGIGFSGGRPLRRDVGDTVQHAGDADTDQRGRVDQVQVFAFGTLPQLGHLFPHHLPQFQLDARQIVHVEAVLLLFPDRVAGPDPFDRSGTAFAAGLGIPDAPHGADVVLIDGEILARPFQDVSVAGGIDDELAPNGDPAALAFHDDGIDSAPGETDLGGLDAVEDADACLGAEFFHEILGGFRIHLGPDVVPVEHSGLVQPPAEFVADAEHGLFPAFAFHGVEHVDDGRDPAAGEESAEEIQPFQQQDVAAFPRGGGSGCESGGAAADHHDIRAVHDRDAAGRFLYVALDFQGCLGFFRLGFHLAHAEREAGRADRSCLEERSSIHGY